MRASPAQPMSIARALALAALVTSSPFTIAACCCFGDDSADRIATLEGTIKKLKAKRVRLKGQIELVDEALKTPANEPLVVATLKPDDIERAIKDALPISFPADRLHNLVSGTVHVREFTDIQVSGNKVSFSMKGKGSKIKINTVVPPGYQKMAKELIGGLQAGLTLKVTGTLDMAKGEKLLFKGKATDAVLAKHNKKDYRDQIRSAVNKKFFASPHPVYLSTLKTSGRTLRPKAALTIDTRLALVFAP